MSVTRGVFQLKPILPTLSSTGIGFGVNLEGKKLTEMVEFVISMDIEKIFHLVNVAINLSSLAAAVARLNPLFKPPEVKTSLKQMLEV